MSFLNKEKNKSPMRYIAEKIDENRKIIAEDLEKMEKKEESEEE